MTVLNLQVNNIVAIVFITLIKIINYSNTCTKETTYKLEQKHEI